MKATGIVRRIDDLGRVVIPKEIRRTMRIREGDPLEIYTNRDGEVIFKKYSLLGGMDDFASQLCETMSRSTGSICAVTDRESVLNSQRNEAHTRIIPIDYDGAAKADTGYSGWIQFADGEIYVVNYIVDDHRDRGQIRGYSLRLACGERGTCCDVCPTPEVSIVKCGILPE